MLPQATSTITPPRLGGHREHSRALVATTDPSPGSVVIVDTRAVETWPQGGVDELVALLLRADVHGIVVIEPTARAARHFVASAQRRGAPTGWLTVASWSG